MNIEINHLTKIYRGDVYALNDLSLVIQPGTFGLVGPNGAGKTTLMRILVGILHPTHGTVQVGQYTGANKQGRTAIKQLLGYLPQELGMYPDLSAYEFLDYVGLLKGLRDRRTRRQRVELLLETVILGDVARRKIMTFSGGMKRRLGIAQALINDPQVLIVDEPTAGLDPEERIRFRNLLSNLGGNRTVLLSTHIVEDIAQTCQQLAVLKEGKILFQGTVSQMIEETRGNVWTITSAGAKPEGNVMVVSTLNMGASVQYRVVGVPSPQAGMASVEPSLEDSYVWFMRDPARALAQGSPTNLSM
jgi:ABC-2 type transport system ATP-binding protein